MTSFTEDWIEETNLTQNKIMDKTDEKRQDEQKAEIKKESIESNQRDVNENR